MFGFNNQNLGKCYSTCFFVIMYTVKRIGVCDSLYIHTTRNDGGSRPLAYTWTVKSLPDSSATSVYLSTDMTTVGRFLVPSNKLPNSTSTVSLNVTLRVSNALGDVSEYLQKVSRQPITMSLHFVQ